jgi:cytochrome b
MHKILVWDLPTRLFHWLLVLVISSQFITGLLGGVWLNLHGLLGYLTLSLIVFRIFWGFWGGYWSRFINFIPNPIRFFHYLKSTRICSTFSRAPTRNHELDNFRQHRTVPVSNPYPGHNPLGALSVFMMLLVLTLQVVSGLMSDDDIAFSGPFSRLVNNNTVDWMTWYHSCIGYYILLFLILLHVSAILYYKFVKAEYLTSVMIHGYKKIEAPAVASIDTMTKRLLALVFFLVSVLLVYLLLCLA